MTIIRRQTSEIKVLERPGPEAVTYNLSRKDCVTITVPITSRWTSGPHWHETHTEFLQVLQGRAFVKLGNRAGVCGPEDGVIEVPKYTVHEWQRTGGMEDAGDLIVREWTMPEDGQKEVFFRMLNSFLTEAQPSSMYEAPMTPKWIRSWIETWVIPLQLFCIFQSWDNWPVIVGSDGGRLSWVFTHAVLRVCSGIGFVIGLRGMYGEYVNEELRLRATTKEDERKTQ